MKEPAKIEKVTDDALSRSIISSVIGILLCMVCLVGTTWAWYSLSVESGVSVTEGANLDFNVTVTKTVSPEDGGKATKSTETLNPTETALPDADGTYTFTGGTHTVTLTKTGTAEKGFCKVEAKKSGEEAEATLSYYIVDFTGEESVSFTVKGSGTLKLIPMWGTPASDYTVIPSEGITLTPDPAAVSATPPPKPETQPDETGSPTDGETGTPEGNTTEGGQIPPDAGKTPPDETPADPGTTEPEEKSEGVIGEQSQTKPETQVEPPVNTETTEQVTVPETQTEQTETSKTTTQE